MDIAETNTGPTHNQQIIRLWNQCRCCVKSVHTETEKLKIQRHQWLCFNFHQHCTSYFKTPLMGNELTMCSNGVARVLKKERHWPFQVTKVYEQTNDTSHSCRLYTTPYINSLLITLPCPYEKFLNSFVVPARIEDPPPPGGYTYDVFLPYHIPLHKTWHYFHWLNF